ncbi:MAG: BON domain-containing protein [Henriciella sp.]
MSSRTLFLSLIITTAPMLTGCVVKAVGAAAMSASQERTTGEAIDDATLSSNIKSKLNIHGSLNEVDVEVAGGLVLLSGRVSSPELRIMAEDLAWSSRRTQDLANEIIVEAPGGTLANASDELISARVRARLLGSSSVKSSNINVETYNGTVYLLGIARSEDELRRAAEEASYAGGVQKVISYIRLRSANGDVVTYNPGGTD